MADRPTDRRPGPIGTGGWARAALVASLVVAASACGSDEVADDDGGPASSLIPGASLPAPTAPPDARAPEVLPEVPNPVSIVELTFEPAVIEVDAGALVTWTNDSELDHWVLSEVAGAIDSAPLEPGNSYAARFDEPGTYDYFCNVHAGMSGTVVVR